MTYIVQQDNTEYYYIRTTLAFYHSHGTALGECTTGSSAKQPKWKLAVLKALGMSSHAGAINPPIWVPMSGKEATLALHGPTAGAVNREIP